MSAALRMPAGDGRAPILTDNRDLAPARQVVHGFLVMRDRCPNYCGKSLEWNTRECAHHGNDFGGSTCCMSGCPILLQEADAKGVR
jgi:hypothetical protein